MRTEKNEVLKPITSTVLKPPITDHLLRSFIQDQDVKQSSRLNYERVLKQYFKWVETNKLVLGELTRVQIIAYKESLLRAGLSSLSVGTYISAVRRFYEWTESNKLYPNIAKGVKSPKRKNQFRKESLTPDQSKALLNYYKERSIRDYAIIALLLGTGIRTVELVRANIDDITFKGGKNILMVQGKGADGKNDFVKLPDVVSSAITTYIKSRKGKVRSSEPLFISTSNNNIGERLSTRTISKIAKEGLRAIGLDNPALTAHSLRHTTAVAIIKSGLGIEYAQGVLRHSSPATTQIYLVSIKDEMRLNDRTDVSARPTTSCPPRLISYSSGDKGLGCFYG